MYEPNAQPDRNNKQGSHGTPINVRQLIMNSKSAPNSNAKNDKNSKPAPYTIIQSFAARLSYNQSKNEILIVFNNVVHTSRQGFPALLFDETDYYVKLVEICKYSLVAKFTNSMPRMELIMKSFILNTQLMGVGEDFTLQL